MQNLLPSMPGKRLFAAKYAFVIFISVL